ncbi:MAG TPA: hypothetical protein VG674_31390 [Amycolatopsis sp.]|nr:hypothetical protein [Amycolatopsis sp.]
MIEAVELVVTALTAGAVAGAKDTASVAVKDAYAGLKALTAKALRRSPEAETSVAALEAPEDHRAELVAALSAAGAGRDRELADAARALLELVDPPNPAAAKYVVDVHDNKGVQIGDGNVMTVRFAD